MQISIWHRGRSPTTWQQCDDVDTGCFRHCMWPKPLVNGKSNVLFLRIIASWFFFCNCIEDLWLLLVERWKYILKNCSNEYCLHCNIIRPTYMYWNKGDICVDNIWLFIYIYCSLYIINWFYTYSSL